MTGPLPRSPLAVEFPVIEPIAGVDMATGRAGLYPRPRDDLLIMRFAPGTTCAGVFTRHGVGSAPVDWCKRQLRATGGRGIRRLVAKSGCAHSLNRRARATAAERVA